MNTGTFIAAEKAAKRFLSLCAAVRKESDETRGFAPWPLTGTATTGALRRASMDLTRALAELRK